MGSTGSLWPVLVLPIVLSIILPIILTQGYTSNLIWNPYSVTGALCLELVTISLFQVTDRSYLDAAIRHAIAEYQCELDQAAMKQGAQSQAAHHMPNGQSQLKHSTAQLPSLAVNLSMVGLVLGMLFNWLRRQR